MGRVARVFVISGPSGVGKGTLVTRVRDRRPDLGLAVSATTRKPREGEVDGVSYYFMTEERFMSLVDQDAFLEWDGHFESRYGTLWSEVNRYLDNGSSVILEIDVKGALNVRKAMPQAVLVFVAPPSLEALEQRLRGRGTEDDEKIALRLSRVQMEIEHASHYDETIVNDDLELAVDQLEQLIDRYETDGGTDQDVCH